MLLWIKTAITGLTQHNKAHIVVLKHAPAFTVSES